MNAKKTSSNVNFIHWSPKQWGMPLAIIGFLWANMAFSAPLDNISINGYLSVEYEQHVSGDKEGDTNGSFDMDLIDLVINITPSPKLRIAMDLTWEHGAASEDNRGNVAVEYAFAEYRIMENTKVRAGKMFTNFGIYNEIHTAKPATLSVKEPLSTNKNNKLGSDIRFYPRWLTGIALVGSSADDSSHSWDYVLQISNGETEDEDSNPFEEDDNTRKAFNGRFLYRLMDNVQIGSSFYLDEMEDPASDGDIKLSSYGMQVEWENENGTGIEVEYVIGSENYSSAADSVDRSAYTFMFYCQLSNRFIPYFRHEYLDPDDSIDDDEGMIDIIGVNILIEENVYVKLELDRFDTKEANSDFGEVTFTEFKASLSIGF